MMKQSKGFNGDLKPEYGTRKPQTGSRWVRAQTLVVSRQRSESDSVVI